MEWSKMRLKQYLKEKTVNTAQALKKLGYRLGASKKDKKKETVYLIMTPDGKAEWLTTKQIVDIIS